jgi:hypothetical protein
LFRFIIGNIIGSLLVLIALIVFIEIGVEAFRVNGGSDAVSAVGATLNAVSGAGMIANEKLGDNKDTVTCKS